MVDERDMSRETGGYFEARARSAIKNMERNGISAQFVPGREEALAVLLDMIPPGATVGRGDSVTLEQIGILSALRERGMNRIADPFERDEEGYFLAAKGQTGSEARQTMVKLRLEAMLSDIFLTGTNAVTLDGKLVNVDGHGNRVAPMLFGPEKVIFVAGASKIVADVDEALDRIQNVVAPINNRRHALKHHTEKLGELPCAQTGKCSDCKQDWRTCRYTVIIQGTMPIDRGRLNVVLVGEQLGI